MDIGVISMRYARALLKSATDQKQEDAVYQEMMTVAKSYLDVPALRHTIDNPMLSKDKKEALLLVAAGDKPCELTKAFIALVLKEDRENVMQFMANSYITLYRKQKNVIRGKLTTSPLQPASLWKQNKRCVRWWRVRLMVLWSLRLRWIPISSVASSSNTTRSVWTPVSSRNSTRYSLS